MSATVIQIKQSQSTSVPPNNALAQGELAYSFASDKLFIGENTNGDIIAREVGGQFYTNLLSASEGVLSASKSVILGASKQVDEWNVDNITLNGNTISTSSGNLILSPIGTIDASSNKIVNLSTPTNSGDAVNKSYVDSVIGTVDNYGSWTAQDGDGTTYALTANDTLVFNEGNGVDINFTADDTLTFTNTDRGSSQNIFKTVEVDDTDTEYSWSADTSGGAITADSNNDSLTFVSGSGIDVDADSSSDAIRISHDDTSSQSSVSNSGGTVVQSVTLDTFGHVTNLNSKSLAYSDLSGLPTIGDGTITVSGSTGLSGSGSFTVNQTGNTSISLTNSDRGSAQNIFKNLTVDDTDSGYTWSETGSVVADSNNDTATFISGSGVDLDVDSSNDAIRVSHSDTSSQASVNNSGGTVIQDVTLDSFGHITGLSSKSLAYSDLSGLPTIGNGTITVSGGSGLSGSGSFTVNQTGSTSITLNNTGVTSISGTTNEVDVSSSTGAVTIGLPSSVTISDALTVNGDLIVNGTTTTINATNTTVQDNLIELNSGASSNANDSGVIIERGSTGDNALMIWDESEDKFALGTTTATAGDTGDLAYTPSTLIADLEGTSDLAIDLVGGSANEVVYQDGTDSTAFVSDSNTSTAQYGTFLAQSSANGPPVWTNVIDGGTF